MGISSKTTFDEPLKAYPFLVEFLAAYNAKFAMRDAEGAYRGTLEVSQDITSIRPIAGERRVLDWDDA